MRSRKARSEILALVLTSTAAGGCLARVGQTLPSILLEQKRAEQFRDQMRAGMEAHERGEYVRSEALFLAAATSKPSLPEPRMAASLSAQRQFHYDHAERWLRGALAVAPDRDDVRVLLTGILLRQGKTREAAVLLQALRAHGATSGRTLHELQATLHFRSGRYDEAVEEFAYLLEARADDPVGHLGIGAVRAVAGDMVGAQASLERARAAAPQSALPDYNLALVHYYCGRMEQAQEAAESALHKDPLYLPAMINLAAIYLREQRDTDAEAMLRRAMKIGAGTYAPAYANYGVLEYDRGAFVEAAQLLGQACQLAPLVPTNHYNLAMALYRTGRWEQAVHELGETLKLNPRHRDAARNKRWIEELMGGAKGGLELPRPAATLQVGEFAT
jgi:tetratricopeptide (TPR) repeat protein